MTTSVPISPYPNMAPSFDPRSSWIRKSCWNHAGLLALLRMFRSTHKARRCALLTEGFGSLPSGLEIWLIGGVSLQVFLAGRVRVLPTRVAYYVVGIVPRWGISSFLADLRVRRQTRPSRKGGPCIGWAPYYRVIQSNSVPTPSRTERPSYCVRSGCGIVVRWPPAPPG
jgi:hypothetical protein